MTDHSTSEHDRIFGYCDNTDPDHEHVIVDHHDQSDLARDGKCPECRAELDDSWCEACEMMRHEHFELYPPPGSAARCPTCLPMEDALIAEIEMIALCTKLDIFTVFPCQHELSDEDFQTLIKSAGKSAGQ